MADTRSIGAEITPLAEQVIDVLLEHDPVTQLQALELTLTSFAMRMDDKKAALLVADSAHKHVRQLIEQFAPLKGWR